VEVFTLEEDIKKNWKAEYGSKEGKSPQAEDCKKGVQWAPKFQKWCGGPKTQKRGKRLGLMDGRRWG